MNIRQFFNNIETDFIQYNKDQFTWNDKSLKFIAEASDLRIGSPAKQIILERNGRAITFSFTHADMDESNEDTYGWNYVSTSGGDFACSLLIIND